MQRHLELLKKAQADLNEAERAVDAAVRIYHDQEAAALKALEQVRASLNADPTVMAARTVLAMRQAAFDDAEAATKQAVGKHWQEQGFPSGKKSDVVDGVLLKVSETTIREITDVEAMLAGARENGVYAKVIKSVKPVVNRKAWNAWVDLQAPPGVKIRRGLTVKVEVGGYPEMIRA